VSVKAFPNRVIDGTENRFVRIAQNPETISAPLQVPYDNGQKLWFPRASVYRNIFGFSGCEPRFQ